ncbi:hypothetical protein GYMLUDRAFT_75753 [Collybiopsis luxurians FD-317 M1]|uniref:Uncharacterized protein n=1 Tax=Collybiopsis luxurians FD-317 M1 TaxID=944289 RepID=A0A0D0C490_9AGAR|nr:hypothetical protein GYMLUDRAFT_75753 [Collybiopsis luxurians FD-317 M1]
MALQYSFVIDPFIVITIGVLLYGIYLTLLSSAIYLLAWRQSAQGHRKFHIVALVALFIFATAAVVVDIIGSAGAIIVTFEDFDGTITSAEQGKSKALFLNILEETVLLMYSLANIVADIILISRLYIVWGCRKRVVVVPVIIVILNNILAILDATIRLKVVLVVDGPENETMSTSDIFWTENATVMTLSFMIVNLVVNTLVTGLIAGRIWWISRKINASYGRNGSQRKYRRVIAIILESGVLYPVSILIALLIGQLVVPSPNLFAILAEIVAIAPTLIIVRVAMGVDVNDEQTAVYHPEGASSGIRGAEQEGFKEQEKLSALRFASGDNTQFTSVINLSMASDR